MQDHVLETALGWHRGGKPAALATVLQTWGSAPRPVGAQLAISGEAEIEGSVSGGCVEAAVVAEALDAVEDGRPRILEYGVSDDEAFAVGLACGGTIRVLLEPIGVGQGPDPKLLSALAEARAARQPRIYAVDLDGWGRRLIAPPDQAARFTSDRSGIEEGTFFAVHNPSPRMAVIGAAHIAQALVPMARLAGWDVTVIDPRAAFATEARFPGTELMVDWPDAALAAHGLDSRTAVVTLTHDPKIDDPAIEAALAAGVFYLGCLGSTRTHAKRVDRLRAKGFAEEAIATIHAPLGLPIGAATPAEIALSALAQITERLRT